MPTPGTSRPPLPNLTPLDAAIFEDLVADADLSLPAIAAKHGIPPTLALERITADPISAYLAIFDRFVSIRETSRQSLAISRLTKLMDSSPDPAEQRRAASAVLQASFKLLYPPRSRQSSSRSFIEAPDESSSRAAASPAPRRTPAISPPAPTAPRPPSAAAPAIITSPPLTPLLSPNFEGYEAIVSLKSPLNSATSTSHAAAPVTPRAHDRPRPRANSPGSLALAAGAPP